MMYYYWKTKGIRPSIIYNMPVGEKMLISAFYEKEIEERHAYLDEVDKKEGIIFPVHVI